MDHFALVEPLQLLCKHNLLKIQNIVTLKILNNLIMLTHRNVPAFKLV